MGSKRLVINVGDEFGRLKVISTEGYYSTCKCECGEVRTLKNSQLKKSKGCGKCPRLWLVGQRFNLLTVVSWDRDSKSRLTKWVCSCDCGGIKVVDSAVLREGKDTLSCGCSKHKNRLKDITGKIVGRLTAVSPTGVKSNNGDMLWNFTCECGNTPVISIGNFNFGHTKSCGCLARDSSKTRSNYHGMQDTNVYNSWRKMRERCNNPNDILYPKYGGNGIKVSERWDSSFKDFYKDMGDCLDGFTIDRIDTSKGYYKENCRWSSNFVQSRNKRSFTGTSKYKGVQFENSSQKWIVTMTVGHLRSKKVGRYEDEYHAAQVYNMVSEEIFGKGCTFLELNDVSGDYSNIIRKGKFFHHWLPLMIEEKERLYEQE